MRGGLRGGGCIGRFLRVALREPLDASLDVEDVLRSRVERMAAGADLTWSSGLVDPVVYVRPQAQMIFACMYLGWIFSFMGT